MTRHRPPVVPPESPSWCTDRYLLYFERVFGVTGEIAHLCDAGTFTTNDGLSYVYHLAACGDIGGGHFAYVCTPAPAGRPACEWCAVLEVARRQGEVPAAFRRAFA